MKRKWIPIAVLSSLALLGGMVAGGVYVYNRISYDVVSYNLVSIGTNGLTLQVVFSASNDTQFDVDVWNQYYDIYVFGYKVSEITSLNRYKILAGQSSLIPLQIDLFWDELQTAIPSIGLQTQITSIADLPVVIRGRLAAQAGIFRSRWIPVRWTTTVGYFLP